MSRTKPRFRLYVLTKVHTILDFCLGRAQFIRESIQDKKSTPRKGIVSGSERNRKKKADKSRSANGEKRKERSKKMNVAKERFDALILH